MTPPPSRPAAGRHRGGAGARRGARVLGRPVRHGARAAGVRSCRHAGGRAGAVPGARVGHVLAGARTRRHAGVHASLCPWLVSCRWLCWSSPLPVSMRLSPFSIMPVVSRCMHLGALLMLPQRPRIWGWVGRCGRRSCGNRRRPGGAASCAACPPSPTRSSSAGRTVLGRGAVRAQPPL